MAEMVEATTSPVIISEKIIVIVSHGVILAVLLEGTTWCKVILLWMCVHYTSTKTLFLFDPKSIEHLSTHAGTGA